MRKPVVPEVGWRQRAPEATQLHKSRAHLVGAAVHFQQRLLEFFLREGREGPPGVVDRAGVQNGLPVRRTRTSSCATRSRARSTVRLRTLTLDRALTGVKHRHPVVSARRGAGDGLGVEFQSTGEHLRVRAHLHPVGVAARGRLRGRKFNISEAYWSKGNRSFLTLFQN